MNSFLNFYFASLKFAFGVELWYKHLVTYMYQQDSDIAILFSSITNCISTFASKISILSVIFHDSEFSFLKFISILKIPLKK